MRAWLLSGAFLRVLDGLAGWAFKFATSETETTAGEQGLNREIHSYIGQREFARQQMTTANS